MRPTRYNEELIRRYKKFWEPVGFSQLWEKNAEKYPEKEALVDSFGTRLTWAEAKRWMDRLALGFVELGIKRDEVIVFQLPNTLSGNVILGSQIKQG